MQSSIKVAPGSGNPAGAAEKLWGTGAARFWPFEASVFEKVVSQARGPTSDGAGASS